MEFGCYLNQPGSSCTYHASEVRIVYLSIHRRRTIKLRVVEYVEGFDSDIKRFRFRKAHRFADLHIEVQNTRAVEKAARRVTQLSKCLWGKQARVEFRLSIAGIRIDLERTRRELRSVQQLI